MEGLWKFWLLGFWGDSGFALTQLQKTPDFRGGRAFGRRSEIGA